MSIENKLNYIFFDKVLLERALTRRAYADEQRHYGKLYKDQEAFCTLGDAVLKTILSDLLMDAGCQTRASITTKKNSLNVKQCSEKLRVK